MPKILRPANNFERYNIVRQNVKFYNNVSFTVKYKWEELYNNLNPIADNTKIIDKAKEIILRILYPSMKKLILKHPSLSSSIRGAKTSQPLYILLSQIDLSSLIRFIVISNDEKDLTNVLEQEHDISFDQDDETKPLWRMIVGIYYDNSSRVRPDYDLFVMFCWHHGIGDGRSGYAIHNTFIDSINSTLQEKNYSSPEHIISIPDTQQICEPLEKRINVKPNILRVLKEGFIELLLPSILKKSILTNYWAGDVHSKDIPDYHTRVLLCSIENDDFEKLSLITRQNQTSIQAVLHTAILFSASHHLNDDDNKSIRTSSPISLRPYAIPPISSNDMGNYVSEFISDYKVPINKDNAVFWELCHQYKSQLKNNISSSIEHVGMLNYLSKDNKSWEDFFKQKLIGLPMGRGYSIELSNFGDYSYIDKENVKHVGGDWKIVGMHFSQSAQVVGATVMVNSISYDNKLNISVTYRKGVVSDEKVKEFRDGIIKCLKSINNNSEDALIVVE